MLYRFWKPWQHYAGALAVGVVYPALAWASFDLGSMTLAVQIGFVALVIVSALGGTALGVVIADRLETAGVARLARRRPAPATVEPQTPA